MRIEAERELIRKVAIAIHSYGYDVYISNGGALSGIHGCYTNGSSVVTFGIDCGHVRFSGTYTSERSGTGWGVCDDSGRYTKELIDRYIKASVPINITTEHVKYHTIDSYMARWGNSSYHDRAPFGTDDAPECACTFTESSKSCDLCECGKKSCMKSCNGCDLHPDFKVKHE